MALWLDKLTAIIASGQVAVLLTVLATKGSTPREVGTKMLITADDCIGTIGGGHLEYQCIAMARQRLQAESEDRWRRKMHRFPLGASLGQCCGGVVTMLLEYIDQHDQDWLRSLQTAMQQGQGVSLVTPLHTENPKFWHYSHEEIQEYVSDQSHYFVEDYVPPGLNIMLFGAGHVGRALVSVLANIDCSIVWVDSRAEQFPEAIPTNTRIMLMDEPEEAVTSAPVNSCFLVMTHSHPLDQRICEIILQSEHFRFCGLIGSLTKRRKFEQRLRAKGFSNQLIERLSCPIGIGGISGKQPEVIAISVAAQLLRLL